MVEWGVPGFAITNWFAISCRQLYLRRPIGARTQTSKHEHGPAPLPTNAEPISGADLIVTEDQAIEHASESSANLGWSRSGKAAIDARTGAWKSIPNSKRFSCPMSA